MLEQVHTSCLRSILGVKLLRLAQFWHNFGLPVALNHKLSHIITASKLRWLGHVGCMDPGSIHILPYFSSSLHSVKRSAKVGRPRIS